MQKREYEIGERLTVNDPELGTVTLEAVEDNIETCKGCFFYQSCTPGLEDRGCHRGIYDLHEGSCSFACRSDHKNIRYMRVEE